MAFLRRPQFEEMHDHYKDLRITRDATPSQIQEAYQKEHEELIKAEAYNKNLQDSHAYKHQFGDYGREQVQRAAFQILMENCRVEKAFKVLADPQTRAAYDDAYEKNEERRVALWLQNLPLNPNKQYPHTPTNPPEYLYLRISDLSFKCLFNRDYLLERDRYFILSSLNSADFLERLAYSIQSNVIWDVFEHNAGRACSEGIFASLEDAQNYANRPVRLVARFKYINPRQLQKEKSYNIEDIDGIFCDENFYPNKLNPKYKVETPAMK